MDFGAALIALATGVLVKGAVMILAARLVARVFRAIHSRPPKRPWLLVPREHRADLRVLFWALVLFAVSELTCGVEVYVLSRSSAVLASIHAVTSALGMGLFALGLYLHADRAVLRFGSRACVGNRICRGCTFVAPAGCRYRVVLVLVGSFVVLATVPPFFAPVERMVADMRGYAVPLPEVEAWWEQTVIPWLEQLDSYDRTGTAFYLPSEELFIEYRAVPALALVLAMAATVLLHRRREKLGIRLLVFAIGLSSYTYFELVLYRVTGDVLIGTLGHEIVEFWFLLITAELLTRTFSAAAPCTRIGT